MTKYCRHFQISCEVYQFQLFEVKQIVCTQNIISFGFSLIAYNQADQYSNHEQMSIKKVYIYSIYISSAYAVSIEMQFICIESSLDLSATLLSHTAPLHTPIGRYIPMQGMFSRSRRAHTIHMLNWGSMAQRSEAGKPIAHKTTGRFGRLKELKT